MSKPRELVSRLLWKLCRCIPVKKNRVVFCSFYGRGYSDSPKAICEALRRSGEKLELCWIVKDEQEARSLPADVRPIPYHGLARLKALASAKVWVDNCRKYESIKKKSQFYLQTWHGFALKRIEADVTPENLGADYIAGCKKDSLQCDLIVSGSRFMTGLYRRSFWYDGEVAETGTPRNDVFFAPTDAQHEKVCAALSLPKQRRLALYAPTFRADGGTDCYRLDAEGLRKAAEQSMGGDWTLLVRLHPNVAEQSKALYAYDGDRLLDATAYPDMQELLCAAELLITDYSSSMFDYALSGRPVVRYVPDLAAYAADRSFYFAPDALPFPSAEDSEALCRLISRLPPHPDGAQWRRFTEENGFCEDGRASERCAAIILARMRKETSK